MWQETKHGLYKRFNFVDFKSAFAFMTAVAGEAERLQHHPRWENEWSVVQIWLTTHEAASKITEKDRELARAIDALEKDGIPTEQWASTDVSKPKSTKRPLHVKLFSDGGSRGNPGPSACGFVLIDENDKVIMDDGLYLGVTTNNQAEYMGLRIALEAAIKLGVREVDCYLDSMLVVNQMRGIFKIKNRDLWPVHGAIKDLLPKFDSVHFQHVPREHNKLADAAVNRVLDKQLRIT